MIRDARRKYVEATEFFQTLCGWIRDWCWPTFPGRSRRFDREEGQAREEFRRVLRADPGNREGLLALAQLEKHEPGLQRFRYAFAEPILADLRRSSAGILLL